MPAVLSDNELKNKTKRIVVCIPAFNEEGNIGKIVGMVQAQGAEVIVCDDGSSDSTYSEAVAARAKVVRHPYNKGYGAAIKTLFAAAKESGADVMVTIDSDGQHNPDQIPAVVKPILEEGYDIVIGSRFLNAGDRKKVPAYRSFGIKTITKIAQLTSYNKPLTDAQSGFRAYSKSALEKIDLVEDGMAVSTEILMRAGQRNLLVKEVPITIRYDVENASTHNPLVHGIGVLVTMIRFASLKHPFTFYGLPGFAFLAIAVFFMTGALNAFSATRFVSTNMIVLSIGTAMIGVVLLVTGVILNTLTALLRERMRTAP